MPDARSAANLIYRGCQSFEELDACVDLQVSTWGFADGDVIPRRMFLIAQKIGGQVIGCFDPELLEDGNALDGSGPGSSSQGTSGPDASAPPKSSPPKIGPNKSWSGSSEALVAFAMALPGVRDGKPYLHSHMLAVREGYRDRGVGRRLKLMQREDALRRGLTLMEWTFDPLVIKNAFLNIARLGVIIHSYTSDFYGVSSSRLQGGLPTDRLHAEWWMDTPRVRAVLEDAPVPNPKIQETIFVPRSVGEWKNSPQNWQRAARVQTENRERFQSAFARDLAVVGFAIDGDGNGIYQLGARQELESTAAAKPASYKHANDLPSD